jgi:hypothetical protein
MIDIIDKTDIYLPPTKNKNGQSKYNNDIKTIVLAKKIYLIHLLYLPVIYIVIQWQFLVN